MHIIYSHQHTLHNTDGLVVNGQPFIVEDTPQRARLILSAVIAAGLGVVIEPVDYGLEPILAVHHPDYVTFLKECYPKGQAYYKDDRPLLPETYSTRRPQRKTNHPIGSLGYYAFGTGSPILAGTWQAAYWSAQCAVTAAQLVNQGQRAVYALCRPPGHHAGVDYYGGFCYLNNAAIAAHSLPGRSAILDIDYHHGNGTQDIFYDNPDVLYCSIHADPDQDYPYFWGSAAECGEGVGTGCNLNFPLPLGVGDKEYLAALDTCLDVICQHNPDNLVVSLGLDILQGDPVGRFTITLEGLESIAEKIAALNRAGLPTVIIQEGGYHLELLGSYAARFLSFFD
jgi:acetoin utilization deacetylase AcuC-like enzyme